MRTSLTLCAQNEHGQPILFAAQFYGSGRTFYVGSPELWRLRAVDEEYFDRFWTKVIREVGQGRLRRGTARGCCFWNAINTPWGRRFACGPICSTRNCSPWTPPRSSSTSSTRTACRWARPDAHPRSGSTRAVLGRLPRLAAWHLSDPGSPATRRREAESVGQNRRRAAQSRIRQSASERQTAGGPGSRNRWQISNFGKRGRPSCLACSPTGASGSPSTNSSCALWDRQWVLYLLVGLLGVEWLTRKLLVWLKFSRSLRPPDHLTRDYDFPDC